MTQTWFITGSSRGFGRALAQAALAAGDTVVAKTLVVEPSGFATDWAGSSMTIHDIPAEYESTIGLMHSRIRSNDSGAAGDPERAAAILVEVAKRQDVPDHLLLGVNAATMALDYSERQLEQARAWEPVSRSADFAEPYPAPMPA